MSRQRAKERACEKAIKETLAYRSVFKYPLSFHQLATFLVSKRRFDRKFFKKTLRRLLKNGSVKVKDKKYYLPGTKPLSWDLRTKRTKRMLKKNKDVFELIGKIPWVKLVGVTGSVAAYNTDKKSDVDIFVITTKNRMWLSRGFSVVFLKNILKRYPKKGKSAGQICPNIFIDEKNLEWPKKQQNIYTAHEIVMMQPIINKDDMYFKFIKANNWIHKYFPHFRVNCPKKFTPTHKENSKIVDLLEKAAMSMETKYMQKKKTKEITTKHMIHFKKYDNMDRILKKFKKKAKKAKK